MTTAEHDHIRQRIKARLVDLSMSQSELARRSGIPRPSLCRWLTGGRKMTDRLINRLLEVLDLEVRQRGQ